MARKPLRSQLNQIRAWVREGRTHAWIAHQLDLSASELRDFIRRHDLEADSDGADDSDLRDSIEAEIEASMEAEPDDEDEEEEDEEQDSDSDNESDDDSRGGGPREGGGRRPRRRRRRRPKRAGSGLEGSFDHGEADGYGLWLDPAVAEDPIYVEHWKGHRPVDVTIEADRIVIRRSGEDDS